MNRAGYDFVAFDLEEDGPFSICQQFRSIHHPESRAAERLQLLYRASRYLAPWDAEGMDGWTGNFKAAEVLCHGFLLHPREAFQLQRLEFNPRIGNPLSDWDLWKVIIARAGTGCGRESGWLNNGAQIHRMQPRAPHWMAGRTDVMFWVPDLEIGNRWIEKVARRESSQVTDFAFRVLSLRSWQEPEDTRKGPPLQDHPILGHEIAAALGISPSEVDDVLVHLIGRNHIVTMNLRHVPGIYSEVFVPNCFGQGNA
jgi:hypothetical protein